MARAALYIRTNPEGTLPDHAAQQTAGAEYAKEHGHDIVTEYEDLNAPGHLLYHKPGLKAAINNIKEQEDWEVLIVADPRCVSDDASALHELVHKFSLYGNRLEGPAHEWEYLLERMKSYRRGWAADDIGDDGYNKTVKALLTILGMLLLLPTMAGAVFGVFMALDPKTRSAGMLFVVWWVPGVVAAFGILIRDPVTFVIGLLCFAVAGLALTLEERLSGKPEVRQRFPTADSERTTQQNKIKDRDEDASKGA